MQKLLSLIACYIDPEEYPPMAIFLTLVWEHHLENYTKRPLHPSRVLPYIYPGCCLIFTAPASARQDQANDMAGPRCRSCTPPTEVARSHLQWLTVSRMRSWNQPKTVVKLVKTIGQKSQCFPMVCWVSKFLGIHIQLVTKVVGSKVVVKQHGNSG